GGRLDDRAARVHHRARAAGAAAGEQLVRVALQEADAIERAAEFFAQPLRKRRRMALTVVQRAGDDRHRPVLLEPHPAHLLVGRCGDLEIAADADAAHAAALLRLAFARSESLPVGALERLL